jgi:hypothetical protein
MTSINAAERPINAHYAPRETIDQLTAYVEACYINCL